MIDIVQLKQKFKKSGGVLKASALKSFGLNYVDIQKLITNGTIERIKTGYYKLLENNENMSEAALIASLFPDGVLCMYTALYYYRYTDRTPLNWDIAINKNTSKSRFNLDYPYVKPYYTEPALLEIGVSEAEYEDCTMCIFDRDRLICECLKYESKMDRETFNKAIQTYINDPRKSISNLIKYAKLRRVAKKVRNIIGVWL